MDDIGDSLVKRKPGRPFKSKIRDNMVEILYNLKEAHGYQILKIYQAIYGPCAMKSIYYNLKRGADLNVFELVSIEVKEGDYSWGGSSEHVYYRLGPNAKPRYDQEVSERIERIINAKKNADDKAKVK